MDEVGEKLRAVRLFALDFDGVFTDNRVWVDDTGREMVVCDRGDSLGLKMIRELRPDIKVVVISKETSGVVKARCDKLRIQALTGINDKAEALKEIIAQEGVPEEQTAFIGNDLNDLACIRMAGVGIAVADAVEEARKAADYVTRQQGGQGAIREVTDIILGIKASSSRKGRGA
jgi:3-deoxy-D-manno-octulosonate 8-phosphate phosphatase (KDO 8-P phosphatase)